MSELHDVHRKRSTRYSGDGNYQHPIQVRLASNPLKFWRYGRWHKIFIDLDRVGCLEE